MRSHVASAPSSVIPHRRIIQIGICPASPALDARTRLSPSGRVFRRISQLGLLDLPPGLQPLRSAAAGSPLERSGKSAGRSRGHGGARKRQQLHQSARIERRPRDLEGEYQDLQRSPMGGGAAPTRTALSGAREPDVEKMGVASLSDDDVRAGFTGGEPLAEQLRGERFA